MIPSIIVKSTRQRCITSSSSRVIAATYYDVTKNIVTTLCKSSIAPALTTSWSSSYVVQKQCFSTSECSSTPSSSPLPSSSLPPTPPPSKNDNDKKDEEHLILGDGIDSYTKKLMQNRHEGIVMNSKGISQHVLPGDYIVKTNPKTGDKKMVGLERSMGYFWDLKDLTDTNEKPIVSNEQLIPLEKAQILPPLHGNLTSLEDEEVELPGFITKNNRSNDPTAECTLLLACFNEYGNKMLPSWSEPFEEVFSRDHNRIKVVWLSLNEGRVLNFLSSMIIRSSKNIVPDYRKKNFLMYFGDCADFRDVIRMHNRKTGYAYLLDGLGRVRFAGSGRANEEDIKRIISFTKTLAPGLKADRGRSKR